ncbi:MAG: hypothetical protein FD152_531 [Xanthobacteraceae bacterium]|nr:MAG: hypothetical protein FD152_531 [Xanthobacteraceae bacterium]
MKPDNDNTKRNPLPDSCPPRGLRREEAAAYIAVSPVFFDHMVRDKLMPRAKRVGGRNIWDRHALDRYFSALPGGDDEAETDKKWDFAV